MKPLLNIRLQEKYMLSKNICNSFSFEATSMVVLGVEFNQKSKSDMWTVSEKMLI